MEARRVILILTCLFCEIVGGRIAARLVFEDEVSLASRSSSRFSALPVDSKEHYETLADLPENLIEPFFKNAQLLSRAVESATAADGTSSR